MNNREWAYSSDDCPDKYFIVNKEDYVHSLDKETHSAIIDALLTKKGILNMRIDEAYGANADDDHEEAVLELVVVIRALKQLRYEGEK